MDSTITIQEDILTLNIQDMIILKQFLEKGRRADIFTDEELKCIDVLQAKFNVILENVIKKQKTG